MLLPESAVQFVENNPKSAPAMAQQKNGAAVEGQFADKPFGLVDTKGQQRQLYWFKGLKLEVIDEKGKVMPTAEFICHLNLDVDKDFRNKVFFEGEPCRNNRIFTATQGETDMCFPEGFAVPAASDEFWTVYFQAANRTTDEHRRLRHRLTMFFIKDSELVYPLKALDWYAPFVTVVVDRDTPEAMEAEHEHIPHCLGSSAGVTAPNSAPQTVFTDGFGRRVSGHWVVPPGRYTYHGPITEEREPAFSSTDRRVHFAWSHVHPCCTSVSLVRCGAKDRAALFTANVQTKTDHGLELLHIDTISSKDGIVLPAGEPYEIEAHYENTTESPLDSMVSLGIFFEDNRFVRPEWALAKPNNEAFCGAASNIGKGVTNSSDSK